MATQWDKKCTQIKRIQDSVSTIFTNCIGMSQVSPFLIRPDLRRATFPPGEGIFPSRWCDKLQFVYLAMEINLFFSAVL